MIHGGDIYRNKVNMDFSVNLNPLGTPEEVLDAVKASIEKSNAYPDIEQDEVRRVIAEATGIDCSCICAGNGASELIMALVRAVAPGRALLFEPCFSGYEHALNAAGCRIIHHELRGDNGFTITKDDIGVISEGPDLVIICDPSSPLGCNVDETVFMKLLEEAHRRGIVLCLDESFYLMSDGAREGGFDRRLGLIERYDNLIIIRSLTKMLAMPGIRMGYAVASPDMTRRIKRQLPEWNLSACSEAGIIAGIGAIYGTDLVTETLEILGRERVFLSNGMRDLGFKVYDSNTAFLLIKGPVKLKEQILERGILIRDCSEYKGLGSGYFRIAVKSHEDNEELLRVLRGIKN